MKTLMLAVTLLIQIGTPPRGQVGSIIGTVRSMDDSPAAYIRIAALSAADGAVAIMGLAQTDALGREHPWADEPIISPIMIPKTQPRDVLTRFRETPRFGHP